VPPSSPVLVSNWASFTAVVGQLSLLLEAKVEGARNFALPLPLDPKAYFAMPSSRVACHMLVSA